MERGVEKASGQMRVKIQLINVGTRALQGGETCWRGLPTVFDGENRPPDE